MIEHPRADDRTTAVRAACAYPPETGRLLTAPRRRAALAALFDRGVPISFDDLVAAVVATDPGTEAAAPADVAIALRHHHLPQLRDAGYVTVDEAGDQLRVALAPGVRQGPLSAAVVRSLAPSEWTALTALHEHPIRRRILEQLHAHGPRLSTARLTRRLATPSTAASAEGPTPGRADLAASLDHLHLPALAEAGLITRAEGRMSYDAAAWVPLADLLAALRAAEAGPVVSVGVHGHDPDAGVGPDRRDHTSVQ